MAVDLARLPHTPAPWLASTDGPFVCGGDDISVDAVEHLDGVKLVRRNICSTMIDTGDGDETSPEFREDVANAKLIAAAPRLLEALILTHGKALCIFPQHPDDQPCAGCRGWRLAIHIFRDLGLEL